MEKITPASIRAMKGRQRIPVLTCYDFPTAKLLDELGIPLLLVGDSLGMVVLGYPDTTHVTMEDIEHHLRAVARAQPRALIIGDMPYHSCRAPEEAVANARRLMTAGADCVKAEGGRAIQPQIEAIVQAGIPFFGHLGMLPQSVHEEGGYHVKGKAEAEREQLLQDAEAVEQAGAFGMVLELVSGPVAKLMTERVSCSCGSANADPSGRPRFCAGTEAEPRDQLEPAGYEERR